MARKRLGKKRVKKGIKEEEPLKRKECPECGSTNIIFMKSGGETICQDCGAIFTPLIPEEEKKFERAKEQK